MSDLKFALTLLSLMEQGLSERTDPEFERLAENCWDPNTDAKKRRRLTIHIDVIPDEQRRNLVVEMDVVTSLARLKKHALPGYLMTDPTTKRPVIVAFDPRQGELGLQQPAQEPGVASLEQRLRARGDGS